MEEARRGKEVAGLQISGLKFQSLNSNLNLVSNFIQNVQFFCFGRSFSKFSGSKMIGEYYYISEFDVADGAPVVSLTHFVCSNCRP